MPIYKKNGKKKYTVRVNYVDIDGNYKAKYGTATTYAQAVDRYKELYENRYSQNYVKLGDLCELFLKEKKLSVKPSTYFVYSKVVNIILKYFNKNMEIGDLTPILIRNWHTKLFDQKCSKTTVANYNNVLNLLMKYAVRYLGLKKNPVVLAEQISKSKNPRRSFYTLDEFNRFIDCIDKTKYYPYWVLYQVLFYTGCRIGEAFALFPSDINLEEQTISITKTYTIIDGQPYLCPPKTTNANRKIKIPQFLAQLLREYIQKLPIEDIRLFFPITHNNLAKNNIKFSKKANLPPIRIHDFRHSAISFLISQNVPIMEISKRVGHSSPEITYKVYAHLYPDKDKKIADLIQKEFEQDK